MSNGGVNLALFFRRHSIFSFGQDPVQQQHCILLHTLNYMRVDIHCKGNADCLRYLRYAVSILIWLSCDIFYTETPWGYN